MGARIQLQRKCPLKIGDRTGTPVGCYIHTQQRLFGNGIRNGPLYRSFSLSIEGLNRDEKPGSPKAMNGYAAKMQDSIKFLYLCN
jgi:hypothetical protein